MSFKSWFDEFYPVAAYDVGRDEALEHSIRKFEGALPENLSRHGLRIEHGTLYGSVYAGGFHFNADTCALCKAFGDSKTRDRCGDCPLYIARGGVRCDERKKTRMFRLSRRLHDTETLSQCWYSLS